MYILVQRAYTTPPYHLNPWVKVLNGIPWVLIHCEGKHQDILENKCLEKYFKALKSSSSLEYTNNNLSYIQDNPRQSNNTWIWNLRNSYSH